MSKAYLIFEDSPRWYMKLFKKDYRHVSVVIPIGEQYLYINVRHSDMSYIVLDAERIERMHDRAVGHVTIMQVDVNPKIKFRGPMLFTCVELVKRVLGVHNAWVFTPYQLYKYFVKQKRRTYVQQNK
jgi:hypothetical protein